MKVMPEHFDLRTTVGLDGSTWPPDDSSSIFADGMTTGYQSDLYDDYSLVDSVSPTASFDVTSSVPDWTSIDPDQDWTTLTPNVTDTALTTEMTSPSPTAARSCFIDPCLNGGTCVSTSDGWQVIHFFTKLRTDL
jgi:hypothetical protein